MVKQSNGLQNQTTTQLKEEGRERVSLQGEGCPCLDKVGDKTHENCQYDTFCLAKMVAKVKIVAALNSNKVQRACRRASGILRWSYIFSATASLQGMLRSFHNQCTGSPSLQFALWHARRTAWVACRVQFPEEKADLDTCCESPI